HDRQGRALRTADQARHVDAPRGAVARDGPRLDPDAHELVQVVTGHASPVVGVPRADLVGVRVADLRDLAVDPPLEASTLAPARELLGGRIYREVAQRSEEHTSELQSRSDIVCRLLLENKNNK